MPTAVGPNTKGEENLVFGYDLGDNVNSFPGIPAVNCAPVPTSRGNWTVTEITDGSITPPRKGARVFKFVTGGTSNLFRFSGYYGGGGFSNNNNINPLILGRTSPSNFTTVSEPNKYRWGFWVRGVESNNAGWSFGIDIGDRGGASYTVGNKTDWYFISCDNATGTNYNAYPYDFFDIFSSNQGLTMYVADMGIMRAPGTVDSLPIMQAYPQWVDYGQERSYTAGLKDITGNSTIDLTNVSFDSNAQMTFDGTNDYANITVSPSQPMYCLETVFYNVNAIPGNDTTIGGPTTYQSMFRFNQDYPMGVHLGAWTSGLTNEAIHIWSTGTSPYNATNTRTAVASGWHHLVFNWNGGYYDIYVDGVQQDVYAHTDGHATLITLSHLTLGNDVSPNYAFNGNLNMVKIYNRALTAKEIKANYNAIKGRFNI